jgi:hypothetical protein
MIARLRKKFILITMGSLVVVLVILMGFINVANFEKLDGNADQVLTILANNGGVFPDVHSMHDKTPPGSSSSSSGSSAPSKTPKPGNILGGLSPEAPYETRFFSVTLKKNGELDSINTGRIAAVSTDEAADMAKELHEEGKTSGYDGNYKYLAKKTSSGTLYVFLDCTRDLGSVKNFFFNSILVSLCGILGVFSLVVPLSRRAIQPVAESYEKQKQFITNAGHEIKTPLAIIDSCAEVLEMEQGESKWTTGIRGAGKAVNRAHRQSGLPCPDGRGQHDADQNRILSLRHRHRHAGALYSAGREQSSASDRGHSAGRHILRQRTAAAAAVLHSGGQRREIRLAGERDSLLPDAKGKEDRAGLRKSGGKSHRRRSERSL